MEKNSTEALNIEDKTNRQIRQMFDAIAPKYDLLNHTLSFGIDIRWRRKGVAMLESGAPKKILDIATGTGDLAITAQRMLAPDYILGIDISDKMMEIGKEKVKKSGLSDRIFFENQDCMSLNIEDNSFDAAMTAFGVRNFENLEQGLSEIYRVLKPSGKLMILELTTPGRFPVKQIYSIYSRVFIPMAGKILSKNSKAYNYLPKTIKAFVQGQEMKQILLKCGFSHVQYKIYTFGICTMYLAAK